MEATNDLNQVHFQCDNCSHDFSLEQKHVLHGDECNFVLCPKCGYHVFCCAWTPAKLDVTAKSEIESIREQLKTIGIAFDEVVPLEIQLPGQDYVYYPGRIYVLIKAVGDALQKNKR